MKPSEMTNEMIAENLEAIPAFIIKEARKYTDAKNILLEAADRLRKADITVAANKAKGAAEGYSHGMEEVADLRSRLKIAEETLEKISKDDLCDHREQAARALSDIRAEGGK